MLIVLFIFAVIVVAIVFSMPALFDGPPRTKAGRARAARSWARQVEGARKRNARRDAVQAEASELIKKRQAIKAQNKTTSRSSPPRHGQQPQRQAYRHQYSIHTAMSTASDHHKSL